LEDYDEYSKQAKLMTSIHASRVLIEPTQDENKTQVPEAKKLKEKKPVLKKKTTLKRL
jgi:hypothetical protein